MQTGGSTYPNRRILGAFLLAFGLSACGGGDFPAPPLSPALVAGDPKGGDDLTVCRGDGYVRYIGVPLLVSGDRIPKDGGYLRANDLPPGSRVVGPDAVVTMDHHPHRLNVMVDDTQTVVRLYCG